MLMTVAALQYCASDNAVLTLKNIKPLIAKAAVTAKLVCLPEAASFLAASREQLQDCAEWEDDSPSLSLLSTLAVTHNIWLLAGSLFLRQRQNQRLVNRSLLLTPTGKIAASYDKIHMFDANIGDGRTYRESDSFSAGRTPVVATAGKLKIGMSICYDLRFPHLYRKLALGGAELLTVPAAFTATTGAAHWHVLLRARAIETGCYVIAPAQYGTHSDGRQTYGHAIIISPWGEILAEADYGDSVITAEINTSKVTEARCAIPSLETNPIIAATASSIP